MLERQPGNKEQEKYVLDAFVNEQSRDPAVWLHLADEFTEHCMEHFRVLFTDFVKSSPSEKRMKLDLLRKTTEKFVASSRQLKVPREEMERAYEELKKDFERMLKQAITFVRKKNGKDPSVETGLIRFTKLFATATAHAQVCIEPLEDFVERMSSEKDASIDKQDTVEDLAFEVNFGENDGLPLPGEEDLELIDLKELPKTTRKDLNTILGDNESEKDSN